ncbi:MAG: hypothetical protein AB7H96_09910 [Vicinamibacterales bacterium]
MKARVLVAVLVATGVAGSAQTLPDVGSRVTMVGCLQRAQLNGSLGGTVVGTSASPARADDEANSGALVDAFLLTQAAPAAVDRPSADAPRPPMSFGLEGHEAELERHQGARVQVTGVVAPPVTSGRGTGGSATQAGTRRIRVESVTALSGACENR